MSTEQTELMTPKAFESMLTNPANNQAPENQEPTEQTGEETETQETEIRDETIADKEALAPEGDTEETPPKTEEEKDGEEKPPEKKLYEVKVDGEVQQVKEEDLKKSYERYAASTQRFMQASELKKQAEAIKAETDAKVEKTKQAMFNLRMNPDAILSFCDPQALHAAFEKYATQHVADQELKEKDPSLYESTLTQRRQNAEIARRQQELDRRQKELDEAQAKQKQDAENSSVQKTIDIYTNAVPEALKAAGLSSEYLDSIVVKEALRTMVNSSWPENLALKDLPQLVNECAKELVKDPFFKDKLSNGKPKTETVEPKKTVTVTAPTDKPKKPEFIRPNDFLKRITARR